MIKITLTKSPIGYNKRQRATVAALGLGKISSSAVHTESDSVMGMIGKVGHLLEVVQLPDPVEVKE